MFSLIGGVFESVTPAYREEKIVFLGLDGAGKSSLIEKLKAISQKKDLHNDLEKMHPTLGLSVSKLAGPNNTTLLEVGGSSSIRPVWQHYYEEATKFVFIVDSSDIDRFDEAFNEFSDFRGAFFLSLLVQQERTCSMSTSRKHSAKVSLTSSHETIAEKTKKLHLPTLLLLNKMDLWNSGSEFRGNQQLGAFLKKCTRDDTEQLTCFSVSYLEKSSLMKVLRWITQEDIN